MRRGAILVSLLLTLGVLQGVGAGPATAGEIFKVTATSTKVRFLGHGYGHGSGMSQHGAQGAATGTWGGGDQTPRTWGQILAFYYPGTTLSSISTKYPRVLLSAHTSTYLTVEARSGLTVKDEATGTNYALPTDKGAVRWQLRPSGSGTAIRIKKSSGWYAYTTLSHVASFHAWNQPVRMYYSSDGTMNHRYRGRLILASNGSGGRDVVNRISMEQYLRGVVPGEMPSSWHANALRAQSVAARTFAANDIARADSGDYYDLHDTIASQVYNGYDAETASTNSAVDHTAGKILTYDGKAIFAQFSSSSGGYTNAGSAPYLVAKADPYDNYPGNSQHSWDTWFSVTSIERAVPEIGDLRSLEVRTRAGCDGCEWGGRVTSIRFTGIKNGAAVAKTLTGTDFRKRMGTTVLKSTWFRINGVA